MFQHQTLIYSDSFSHCGKLQTINELELLHQHGENKTNGYLENILRFLVWLLMIKYGDFMNQ